jgi:hypothetical protein
MAPSVGRHVLATAASQLGDARSGALIVRVREIDRHPEQTAFFAEVTLFAGALPDTGIVLFKTYADASEEFDTGIYERGPVTARVRSIGRLPYVRTVQIRSGYVDTLHVSLTQDQTRLDGSSCAT